MSKTRRSKKSIHMELKKFCRSPRFLRDIMLKVNINSRSLKNAINAGIIEKVDEQNGGWGGPKGHIYQAVNDDG